MNNDVKGSPSLLLLSVKKNYTFICSNYPPKYPLKRLLNGESMNMLFKHIDPITFCSYSGTHVQIILAGTFAIKYVAYHSCATYFAPGIILVSFKYWIGAFGFAPALAFQQKYTLTTPRGGWSPALLANLTHYEQTHFDFAYSEKL